MADDRLTTCLNVHVAHGCLVVAAHCLIPLHHIGADRRGFDPMPNILRVRTKRLTLSDEYARPCRSIEAIHPLLVAQLLALLAVANGMPIIVEKFLRELPPPVPYWE